MGELDLPHFHLVEENDLYTVGWVHDMDELKELLSAFMGKTNMDYRMYRKTKDFGHREMPSKSCRVRFFTGVRGDHEGEDPEREKLPTVPFQGYGFIILPGESYMGCKYGSNYSQTKNERRKAERQAENPNCKTRKPRQSIKLGCPAEIMIKETFCFIDYQCEYQQYHVRKLQNILREKLLSGEGLNVEKRLYIRLPRSGVHRFHVIPEISEITDSSFNRSHILSMIKTEDDDEENEPMEELPLVDDNLDESTSVHSEAKIQPTWTQLFDERYSDVFGWVGTAEKAQQLLKEYERITGTKYVPEKLSRDLGSSEVVSLEGQHIIWEDGGFTTCTGEGTLRIPFEGFPFILLNVKVYKCHMGKYRKIKGVTNYGCWMYIKMKEVIVFPEYMLPDGMSHNMVERMKVQNRLTLDVKEGKPVEAQRRIYIALIPPDDHNHSITMGKPLDVSPDQYLGDRMRDLLSMGIISSDLITRHLHDVTINEIYKDKKPPSRDNKKFFPTEAKIQDSIEVSKRTTKYDGVHFKARAREREELLGACKSLMEDCAKMMHFILGSTALDDVREKLELLHDTMRLYTPDMTHPEVRDVLPYVIDGVVPPTPHQRALEACGKSKPPDSGGTPRKKRRMGDGGDIFTDHVTELTGLFNQTGEGEEPPSLVYGEMLDTQHATDDATLTAAAHSLVEQPVDQPATTEVQPALGLQQPAVTVVQPAVTLEQPAIAAPLQPVTLQQSLPLNVASVQSTMATTLTRPLATTHEVMATAHTMDRVQPTVQYTTVLPAAQKAATQPATVQFKVKETKPVVMRTSTPVKTSKSTPQVIKLVRTGDGPEQTTYIQLIPAGTELGAHVVNSLQATATSSEINTALQASTGSSGNIVVKENSEQALQEELQVDTSRIQAATASSEIVEVGGTEVSVGEVSIPEMEEESPHNIQKVVTVDGEEIMLQHSGEVDLSNVEEVPAETSGADLSVGLNIEAE